MTPNTTKRDLEAQKMADPHYQLSPAISYVRDVETSFRANKSKHMFQGNHSRIKSDHGIKFFRSSVEKMECVKQ